MTDYLYIVQVVALSLSVICAIVALVIIVLIFKNGGGK